jgi:hypothetical protein
MSTTGLWFTLRPLDFGLSRAPCASVEEECRSVCECMRVYANGHYHEGLDWEHVIHSISTRLSVNASPQSFPSFQTEGIQVIL